MNGTKCSELWVQYAKPRPDGLPNDAGWRLSWDGTDGCSYSYDIKGHPFASRRDAELVLRAFRANGITSKMLEDIPFDPNHPDWQRIDRIAAEALPW